jgi:hypothetical protein
MDGDWQLGMTLHFFSEGIQERFAQSRFDAIRELGRIAEEDDCQSMVVCGDASRGAFVQNVRNSQKNGRNYKGGCLHSSPEIICDTFIRFK